MQPVSGILTGRRRSTGSGSRCSRRRSSVYRRGSGTRTGCQGSGGGIEHEDLASDLRDLLSVVCPLGDLEAYEEVVKMAVISYALSFAEIRVGLVVLFLLILWSWMGRE